MIYTKQSKDEDVAQIFVDMLEKDITWIYGNCGETKIKITPKQWAAFEKATKCWMVGHGCILSVDLEYPKELHDLHNEDHAIESIA